MEDKRKYKRYKIDGIEINARMALAGEVIIRNISLGGASLKADKRLNIGEEYLLKLECEESAVPIKGVIVWSLLSESRTDNKGNVIPIYSAGLKFTDGSDVKIKELIDSFEEHERQQYETANKPELDEFVNLSEQFKDALELFAD